MSQMRKLFKRQFIHFPSNMKCDLLFTSDFVYCGIIDAYCSIPKTPLIKWFSSILSPPESIFNNLLRDERHIHAREHGKSILKTRRIYSTLQQSNVGWTSGHGREAADSLLFVINNTAFQQCSQAPFVFNHLRNRK